MASDAGGALVVGWPATGPVVRRTNSGELINIGGLPEMNHAYRCILVEDDGSATYILDGDSTWSTTSICKLDESTVQERRVIHPGCFDEYLAHWLNCLAGLFVAWLLHICLLTVGVSWLTRGPHSADHLSGVRKVKLASVSRRALACFADMMLTVIVAVLLFNLQAEVLGIEFGLPRKEGFCRWLFEYDWDIYHGGFSTSLLSFVNREPSPLDKILPAIQQQSSFLCIVFIEMSLLLGLSSYVEGQFGITPGKWLLGIRTLRTSLRRCGFARALVRSTLFCVDIPFFVTPIPGAVSTVLSRHRRRIGDHVADTVVVKVDSM
jgi:uncharacterized RDD family membrane protein YckC